MGDGCCDGKGFEYKVIRQSAQHKGCMCGNHSCGKEIFFYKKNRILYGIRLLRKNKKKFFLS